MQVLPQSRPGLGSRLMRSLWRLTILNTKQRDWVTTLPGAELHTCTPCFSSRGLKHYASSSICPACCCWPTRIRVIPLQWPPESLPLYFILSHQICSCTQMCSNLKGSLHQITKFVFLCSGSALKEWSCCQNSYRSVNLAVFVRLLFFLNHNE